MTSRLVHIAVGQKDIWKFPFNKLLLPQGHLPGMAGVEHLDGRPIEISIQRIPHDYCKSGIRPGILKADAVGDEIGVRYILVGDGFVAHPFEHCTNQLVRK